MSLLTESKELQKICKIKKNGVVPNFICMKGTRLYLFKKALTMGGGRNSIICYLVGLLCIFYVCPVAASSTAFHI